MFLVIQHCALDHFCRVWCSAMDAYRQAMCCRWTCRGRPAAGGTPQSTACSTTLRQSSLPAQNLLVSAALSIEASDAPQVDLWKNANDWKHPMEHYTLRSREPFTKDRGKCMVDPEQLGGFNVSRLRHAASLIIVSAVSLGCRADSRHMAGFNKRPLKFAIPGLVKKVLWSLLGESAALLRWNTR